MPGLALGSIPSASFGGAAPSGAGIGVASTRVLGVNPLRKLVSFVNDSNAIIYLSKTDPARVNAGIRINPLGGSYIESIKTTEIWQGEWFAIATIAASNLCVQESW